MPSPLTIIFSGMAASDPWQGGATWAVLQYLLGLKQLGHRVYFVEPIEPEKLQPRGATLEASSNWKYFRRVMVRFGLGRRSALLLAGSERSAGISFARLRKIAGSADLLINVSGMLREEALLAPVPVRVYLDLDPAFNQLWQEVQGIDMRFENHNRFVTIGQAIGAPDSAVPTCGRKWSSSLQPVVLSQWPKADAIRYDALTTVGNWRGYGSIEHGGVFYGQKAHAMRSFFELPALTTERFMPAFSIHPSEERDLEAMSRYGWDLLDPRKVAGTPESYREFIQSSKGEFGIAKSGYAASRCGWFSDRSICYLASGRPVIAQETGFNNFLPTGEGLFGFEDIEDVLSAIEALRQDYSRHSRAARVIAEEHFDSDRVLGAFLGKIGALS